MINVDKAQKIMKDFIDLLDEIEKRHCELYDLVKEYDAEQVDIEHEFELDCFYRDEGHRKARRFQKLRRERRVAKDLIESFYPIKEFAKNHKSLKKNVMDVISQIDQIEKTHETRVFRPRGGASCKVSGKHYAIKDSDIKSCINSIEKKLVVIGELRKNGKKLA